MTRLAASAMALPPIRIPTVHDGMGLTPAMAAAMVSAYDPVREPAPIVIGTPKLTCPAYGWITGLSLQGATVFATGEGTRADFASGVLDGTHRPAAASFYAPDNPYNPVPGSHYLKHVSFAGPPLPTRLPTTSLPRPVQREKSSGLAVAAAPPARDDGDAIYRRALEVQAETPGLSIISAAQAAQAERGPSRSLAPPGFRTGDGGEIERRAKQIQLRNPGHPWMAAYRAAQAEAEAVRRTGWTW